VTSQLHFGTQNWCWFSKFPFTNFGLLFSTAKVLNIVGIQILAPTLQHARNFNLITGWAFCLPNRRVECFWKWCYVRPNKSGKKHPQILWIKGNWNEWRIITDHEIRDIFAHVRSEVVTKTFQNKKFWAWKVCLLRSVPVLGALFFSFEYFFSKKCTKKRVQRSCKKRLAGKDMWRFNSDALFLGTSCCIS